MPLVTEIVDGFVTRDLVPKIVNKCFELIKKGHDETEVIDEICSKELLVTTKNTSGNTRRTNVPKPPVVEPVPLEDFEDYKSSHEGEKICLYVFTKGKDKGKVCCRPIVDDSKVDESDDKTYRCHIHEKASSGPDIKAELIRVNKGSSTADRVGKVRESIPRGAPVALSDKSSSTTKSDKPPARSGLTSAKSVRDRLAEKHGKSENSDSNTRSASSTRRPTSLLRARDHKAVSPTPEKEPEVEVELETPKSQSSTSDKDDEVVAETPKSRSSTARSPTPESSKVRSSDDDEPTPDEVSSEVSDFEKSIPLDGEGEMQTLNPTFPSAKKYSWYLIGKKDAIVTNEDFTVCYGVFSKSDDIDPSEDFKVNVAWKSMVKDFNEDQLKWIDSMNAKVAKL